MSDDAPFQTAEEYVFQRLRREILGGEIRGGAHLNQDDVASRLRVSRTPVRQAFLRLKSEGLITIRPNKGAVVTSLSPEDILELFEIRAVLEAYAASMAVQRIDERTLNAVSARANALPKHQSSPKRWVEHHDQFHDYLCELAGRPRLTEKVRRLRQQVTPYLLLYLSANKGAEIAGHEHTNLVKVMGSGDSALAERVVRDHIMSSGRGVVDFVRLQEKRATELVA